LIAFKALRSEVIHATTASLSNRDIIIIGHHIIGASQAGTIFVTFGAVYGAFIYAPAIDERMALCTLQATTLNTAFRAKHRKIGTTSSLAHSGAINALLILRTHTAIALLAEITIH